MSLSQAGVLQSFAGCCAAANISGWATERELLTMLPPGAWASMQTSTAGLRLPEHLEALQDPALPAGGADVQAAHVHAAGQEVLAHLAGHLLPALLAPGGLHMSLGVRIAGSQAVVGAAKFQAQRLALVAQGHLQGEEPSLAGELQLCSLQSWLGRGSGEGSHACRIAASTVWLGVPAGTADRG